MNYWHAKCLSRPLFVLSHLAAQSDSTLFWGYTPFLPIKWKSQNIHLLMPSSYPNAHIALTEATFRMRKYSPPLFVISPFLHVTARQKLSWPFYASWTSRRALSKSQLVNCGVHAFGWFIIGRSRTLMRENQSERKSGGETHQTTAYCEAHPALQYRTPVNCFAPCKTSLLLE